MLQDAKYWHRLVNHLSRTLRSEFRRRKLDYLASKVTESDSNTTDITTQLDGFVHNFVQDYFRRIEIPVFAITEEGGMEEWGRNPRAVICLDEVDGTAQANHGIPEYATTVAVMGDMEDTTLENVIAAATLEYATGNVYSAGKGIGAFRNRAPLTPSRRQNLDTAEAMVALDIYAAKNNDEVPIWLSKLRKLRCFPVWHGSAAMALARVSSGQYDAYINLGQKINDLPAGYLLLKEAGAVLMGTNAKPINVRVKSTGTTSVIAAGNMDIYNQLRALD
ncbi:MAG: inositol monophosphatase family protein [Candidatus Aenigmarchaeota archaeon]|nr:inositol monophosphatase family protein [Candidatus Aenigmarchaeota archaeon]